MNKTNDEFSARRARAIELLAKQKLSAAWFSDAANVRYLTGFAGDDAGLAVCGNDWFLITDARFKIEAAACEKRGSLQAVIHESGIVSRAAEIFSRRRIKKIGGEFAKLTLADCAKFRDKKITVIALGENFSTLRSAKSATELAAIKRAVAIAEKTFRELRPCLRGGMTELEIKAELDYRALKNGAEAMAFPTIVACGAASALPHAIAGDRRWKRGQPLLIDFGVRVDGYVSDLTRTLFLETISPFWTRIYNAVLAAQEAAISILRAGIVGTIPYREAQKIFGADKFCEFFTHGLGHGIGLEIHESPNLSVRANKILPKNCVVTVEPGLYFAGKGGVRIEDDVQVTASGTRLLSSLEKQLADAVI